jgi:hypothetical protein
VPVVGGGVTAFDECGVFFQVFDGDAAPGGRGIFVPAVGSGDAAFDGRGVFLPAVVSGDATLGGRAGSALVSDTNERNIPSSSSESWMPVGIGVFFRGVVPVTGAGAGGKGSGSGSATPVSKPGRLVRCR